MVFFFFLIAGSEHLKQYLTFKRCPKDFLNDLENKNQTLISFMFSKTQQPLNPLTKESVSVSLQLHHPQNSLPSASCTIMIQL